MTEHDPFNEPETAHARSRELMVEPLFWDCVDEGAPFGSDEGWDAYYEWRRWREQNRSKPLTDCLNWILNGRLNEYNESLTRHEKIIEDLANSSMALHANYGDMWTLDTTIIASGLGQLIDEGTTQNPFFMLQLLDSATLNQRALMIQLRLMRLPAWWTLRNGIAT